MISANTIPFARLADNAEDIFRHLGENNEPIIISIDGRPAAVIQDYERYEKMCRGIEFWKILSHRIRDAEQGNTVSFDEAFEEIETNLEELET
jgi:prevent-host-death family protein